ncbi:ParB N-terminal domain-containing protein [Alicyclobacillus macrosporangiidus]|uniref:ParB N-terminal domain-containing protein n=1 Tax=Alicyclobacillus macrosporangiidus TaxID=392015 RepID=UPI00068F642C|nr:ParB N-terminal domain-containing protein [Alicyclobacillus macrosporangiidus]
MLVEIDKIVVEGRIRKDFGDLQELADDIRENGLINPPVVTPELRLIAGERRLRACKLLGYEQIEVRVMTVKDYEHQLRLEISENENRKEFTFSERVEWARRLEQVEALKAKERQRSGVQEKLPEGLSGQTRDIVAGQAGFGSGRTYEKAKFIADHADAETIRKLDEGEISIHRAYEETKRKLAEAERRIAEAERQREELARAVEAARSRERELLSEMEQREQEWLDELEQARNERQVVVEEKIVPPDDYESLKARVQEQDRQIAELSRAAIEQGLRDKVRYVVADLHQTVVSHRAKMQARLAEQEPDGWAPDPGTAAVIRNCIEALEETIRELEALLVIEKNRGAEVTVDGEFAVLA